MRTYFSISKMLKTPVFLYGFRRKTQFKTRVGG